MSQKSRSCSMCFACFHFFPTKIYQKVICTTRHNLFVQHYALPWVIQDQKVMVKKSNCFHKFSFFSKQNCKMLFTRQNVMCLWDTKSLSLSLPKTKGQRSPGQGVYVFAIFTNWTIFYQKEFNTQNLELFFRYHASHSFEPSWVKRSKSPSQ